MSGLQATDLRELAKVRRRIESLDAQGVKLRAQRAALVASLRAGGMTLDQIADLCGVSRQAVFTWAKRDGVR